MYMKGSNCLKGWGNLSWGMYVKGLEGPTGTFYGCEKYRKTFWFTDLLISKIVQSKTAWSRTKVLGHFCICGAFPNRHRCPTPSLTPRTTLDACIQIFFLVLTLYRLGWGAARKVRNECTVIWGAQNTENYEYCITVPRTFVHDCK